MVIADLIPGDILVTIADPTSYLHLIGSVALWSPFVHVTMYAGEGMEYSSDPHGLQKRPVSDKYVVVKRYHGNPDVLYLANYIMEGMLGTPYNYLGAFLLGIQKLLRMRDKAIIKYPHDSRFCSEGISDAWVLAGDDVIPNVPNGLSAPGDFVYAPKLATEGFLSIGRNDV